MFPLITVISLGLLIFTLVDIIRCESWQIRNLDKVSWIFIVILVPLIGMILWFALGRERSQPVDRGTFGDPRRREALLAVDSIQDDAAAIENEIEFHEKQARIRRLEAELKARRDADTDDQR